MLSRPGIVRSAGPCVAGPVCCTQCQRGIVFAIVTGRECPPNDVYFLLYRLWAQRTPPGFLFNLLNRNLYFAPEAFPLIFTVFLSCDLLPIYVLHADSIPQKNSCTRIKIPTYRNIFSCAFYVGTYSQQVHFAPSRPPATNPHFPCFLPSLCNRNCAAFSWFWGDAHVKGGVEHAVFERSDSAVVLFDGECNFCNSGVWMMLANSDKGNMRFCAQNVRHKSADRGLVSRCRSGGEVAGYHTTRTLGL